MSSDWAAKAKELRLALEDGWQYGPQDAVDPHDGSIQANVEKILATALRDAARVPDGCVRTADVSVLQEIQNAMDERCIGEGYCCFCGEEYMTTGLRGDMEDVGYCWICATEKLEVIGPMLPAIIAALAQPTPARGEGE